MEAYSSYKTKSDIRAISINNLTIGADTSISFMKENNNITKPLFALEIPYFVGKNYPTALKKYYGNAISDFQNLYSRVKQTNCDLICIHLNFDEKDLNTKLEKAINEIQNIANLEEKTLILKGTKNKNIDKILLPKIANAIKKPVIIACADDSTYEDIVPAVIGNNHILVLRSPIDINLAKELSILSTDLGLNPNNIIIDSEMGALGYGFDYGYSIIEKIRLAGLDGDNMLNMPIIAFVGEETYKTKEAKSDNFPAGWGSLEERAIMWEISTASGIISAGANIVVVSHPETITNLKEVLWD